MLLATALLIAASGCARSPVAPNSSLSFVPLQADFPEAWSHDGKLIAFRRVLPSNYGPAGIYLISPAGGQPRWLCTATPFWPARLRFSPDDRTLVAINSNELQLIDVASGMVQEPLSTNAAVTGGEWIENGAKILYFRSSYDPESPRDSSWMHVLDLAAGTDQHLAFDGRDLSLEGMRTGSDGRVAAIEHLPTSDRLVIVDPRSAHCDVVYDTKTVPGYNNVQWWMRPAAGRVSLIFEMTHYVGWWITPGDAAPSRFAPGWNRFRLMSPDGEIMVTDGTDPQSRVGVLDLASVDDISGASHRHLTTFAQDAIQSSALGPFH